MSHLLTLVGVKFNTILSVLYYLLVLRAQKCLPTQDIEDERTGKAILVQVEISREVPQGSILGPLFFLLHINGINNAPSLLNLILFADNANVFNMSHEHQDIFQIC